MINTNPFLFASIPVNTEIHTCIRVNGEQFRSNSLELIRDLGI